MVCRFHAGSNRPLAKRSARMFCTASLPRKWSIRKICASSKALRSTTSSARAVARSVPNGFSATSRERSTRSSLASISTMPDTADGGIER